MSIYDKIIIFIATGFYTGYSRFAPGTVGTLLGIPFAFLISGLKIIEQLLIVLSAFFIFSFIAGRGEEYFNKKDASHIVCDEALGFVVTMLFIPYTVFNVVTAFLLFRLFDIWKPFPIRTLENRIKGGYGIVFDDILAGIYANIMLRIMI